MRAQNAHSKKVNTGHDPKEKATAELFGAKGLHHTSAPLLLWQTALLITSGKEASIKTTVCYQSTSLLEYAASYHDLLVLKLWGTI